MPARQGRGGGRAGPALQRAESLLLFQPHPNLHYLPLGGRGHTREGMISPGGGGECTVFLKRSGAPRGPGSCGCRQSRVMPFWELLLGRELGGRRDPPHPLFWWVCAGMPRFSKHLSDRHFLNMYSDGEIRNPASGFEGSQPSWQPWGSGWAGPHPCCSAETSAPPPGPALDTILLVPRVPRSQSLRPGLEEKKKTMSYPRPLPLHPPPRLSPGDPNG